MKNPLHIPNRLAGNPKRAPLYPVTIKNKKGDSVVLGDPNITRGLVALMNMHAVIGGAACHWGGPAAAAEIMSALHGYIFKHSDQKNPWYEKFHLINDAGHAENGLYALRANLGFDDLDFQKLRAFRSVDSKLTGHGESHLNPEGVLLSNGPLGSAVPQAQGLAMADKVLKNDRVTFLYVSDGAAMEGEAKEAFSAIPGLAKKGKLNPFVMILSDNNTKLSGRIDQDSFDMNPSFESLKTLGFELIKIEDGHDLPTVYMAIEEAVELARQNPHKPICLWAKTIKGKGVKSTETSASGGHGYPLSPYDEKLENFIQEIFHQQAPTELVVWAKELATKPTAKTTSTVKKEKVQKGIAKALIECAEAGLPVFSISADLQGSTGVKDFQQKFPENYLEVGVAESNMVSVAVGFAKAGFIPVVDTFAQFGVTKGNLPLTMASLSQGPVIGIFSHTGFQDAADGASHQATTYLAAVAAIPHLESVVCATSAEAYEYLKQTIKKYAHERSAGNDGVSTLFFIGREDFVPQFPVPVTYEWGKAQILHDEKEADVVLVASGPMTHKIWEAKDYFIANGKKAIIINHPFVNHPDIHTIGEALNRADNKLITVEDHQVIGGMGSLLVHSLKQAGYEFRLKSLGIGGEFGRSAYQADQLYDNFQLSAEGVWRAYLKL